MLRLQCPVNIFILWGLKSELASKKYINNFAYKIILRRCSFMAIDPSAIKVLVEMKEKGLEEQYNKKLEVIKEVMADLFRIESELRNKSVKRKEVK